MSSTSDQPITEEQVERLTFIYLDPPKTRIPRFVRDEAMDLWQMGLLTRDDKGDLVLTRLALAAIGAI